MNPTEIRVPKAPADSGTAFVEISGATGTTRCVGAQVRMHGDHAVDVQLAACGVGWSRPVDQRKRSFATIRWQTTSCHKPSRQHLTKWTPTATHTPAQRIVGNWPAS